MRTKRVSGRLADASVRPGRSDAPRLVDTTELAERVERAFAAGDMRELILDLENAVGCAGARHVGSAIASCLSWPDKATIQLLVAITRLRAAARVRRK